MNTVERVAGILSRRHAVLPGADIAQEEGGTGAGRRSARPRTLVLGGGGSNHAAHFAQTLPTPPLHPSRKWKNGDEAKRRGDEK